MSAGDEKTALRREIKALEKELTKEYIAESDEGIFSRMVSLPEYKNCGELFCYFSAGREVSTLELIKKALSDGKTVALPEALDGGVMIFRRIPDTDSLRPGKFGIMVPDGQCGTILPGADALAVVPGMCFGEDCRRLGRGGGYYDRWLAGKNIFTVGLCREKFMRETVPAEGYDVTVCAVVTEARVVRA